MEQTCLIEATLEQKQAILAYRNEFPVSERGIEGTSWLSRAKSIEDWLIDLDKFKKIEIATENYVPAYQYLFVRKSNEKILGMLNLRLELNEYLLNYGGHIGYSIAPSERQKGYATQMLALGLKKAKTMGISSLLITCDDTNIASARTIEKNHGVLENKIVEPNGKILMRRYWVNLTE